MNKIIVVCFDEEHAEYMRRRLRSSGCPYEQSGKGCPVDDKGEELACSDCWALYTEVVVKQ